MFQLFFKFSIKHFEHLEHFALGRCDQINCSYYSECQLNDKDEAQCVCPQVCIR